jgi:hypothetical protein
MGEDKQQTTACVHGVVPATPGVTCQPCSASLTPRFFYQLLGLLLVQDCGTRVGNYIPWNRQAQPSNVGKK